MKRYNPKEIEPRWQRHWADSKIYEAAAGSTKPKKYILEFFPYPSGAAMHVGHVRNYTIGDALARSARMRGYNVLHPMGWDAFGLPAENYAIKTGISPKEAIRQNTGRFKQQLSQMGFGYDWSREFASSDPEYYRWTQWFFLLLHKRGLAYRKESLQWWCPVDKTVLANEQVENGVCWRCGSQVEKKALKQWFFKITDYADRLAADLEDLNWTDSIKNMQRNWIGRSKGAEVIFQVADSDTKITVFTTRPDTLFGATFMVLAPEHPLVEQLATDDQKSAVMQYKKQTQAKSDVERQETSREKSGVFTGSYGINPVNNEKIPIWIADYVLGGYGTGAIMAVPAHDERDFAFATKFHLPVKPVLTPTFTDFAAYSKDAEERPTAIAVGYDPKQGRYCVLDWKKSGRREGLDWPGGGIEEGETIEQAAVREFAEEAGYQDAVPIKTLPAALSVYYQSSNGKVKRAAKSIVLLQVNSLKQSDSLGSEAYEQDAYDVHWLTKEELFAAHMNPQNAAIREFVFNQPIHVGEGVMINSGEYDNLTSDEAREKVVEDLEKSGNGKQRINYKIRDWLISRQRYWGAPIPMIYCAECGIVPVPEDQLPVLLPDMDSFEPSGDGRSPLARDQSFLNTECPKCAGPAQRETDTMDGFACSSWYFLRFADPHNTEAPFDVEKIKQWLPVDEYIGGAEHAVMHLLYARMWMKVMQDAGLIEYSEPFTTLRNQGMILAPDGQKMSKSKGNTIEPDTLIEQGYGADAIRIMELFIGPWNQSANWSVEGMGGSFRFLQRVWALTQEFNTSTTEHTKGNKTASGEDIKRTMHRTIHKVSKDIEELGFNTAIAALMEAVNELYKQKLVVPMNMHGEVWRWAIEALLQLLAPFAPHITEELWAQLGHNDSIHISRWPVHDDAYLVNETLTIVVQVNGKLRGQIEIATDTSKEQIIEAAKSEAKVVPHLAGKEIKKSIYIPGKLVNFVV